MSDRMRKALRDAGRITITIEGDHNGNIKYLVHESAFRLDGFEDGKFTKANLDAAVDSDALIQQEISAAVRRNHISWEARQE